MGGYRRRAVVGPGIGRRAGDCGSLRAASALARTDATASLRPCSSKHGPGGQSTPSSFRIACDRTGRWARAGPVAKPRGCSSAEPLPLRPVPIPTATRVERRQHRSPRALSGVPVEAQGSSGCGVSMPPEAGPQPQVSTVGGPLVVSWPRAVPPRGRDRRKPALRRPVLASSHRRADPSGSW